jgi:ABC-type antimicrobial peptide transport system permease subunit
LASAATDGESGLNRAAELNLRLLGLFAAIAVLLAVVVIYVVMAYSAEQQRHEIGIRAALGANRRDKPFCFDGSWTL